MAIAQPLEAEAPDQGEETARADMYGLLAALFYAPPAQALLDRIAASGGDDGSPLGRAWGDLSVACRLVREEQARDEYEVLFIGVGKPEIMLYGSYYLTGFLMEKPLAALRTDLARLGLEREQAVTESEDHVAALCEVMRYLILAPVDLATQQRFFAAHLQPWVADLCAAIAGHPGAQLYGAVALLAQAFIEVETRAFDMA